MCLSFVPWYLLHTLSALLAWWSLWWVPWRVQVQVAHEKSYCVGPRGDGLSAAPEELQELLWPCVLVEIWALLKQVAWLDWAEEVSAWSR